MAAPLVLNARMYAIAPGARAAWHALFDWLSRASGRPLQIVDHAFPAPLDALWARDDLAAGFMCGWPFARERIDGAARPIVAAPIPLSSPAGRAVYRSHFIVRRESPVRRLEDTFGGRLAYTAETSHSGYNAPRHHLLAYRSAAGRPLYAARIGPLVTPRRVVEAVLAGEADVGPLDSYAHDLLLRHDPALMAGVRIVDSTAWAPIPPLVGSRGGDPAAAARLGDLLAAAAEDKAARPLLAELALAGFARPAAADYGVTLAWATAAAHEIVM